MIRIQRPVCPRPDRLAAGEYNHPENKDALVAASHGKCMYCEAYVRDVSFGDIEHIKPKSRYRALEFVWENLGFVCQKCNNEKRDQFEDTLPYIDPYTEDPETSFVASGAWLFQRNGDARGEKTIRDIQLNRAELIEKRQELIGRIQKAIDASYRAPEPLRSDLIAELKKEAETEKEFSFVIKQRLALEA